MYKNTKRRFVLFCFIILFAGGLNAGWNTEYKLNLKENLKLISRIKFFTAFDAGSDLRSENDIYYKLSDIITLQAGYVVLHEYSETGPRPDLPEDVQTKFSLSAGISYNLFTKN